MHTLFFQKACYQISAGGDESNRTFLESNSGFEVNFEQLEIISNTTRSVFEAIVLLKQLARDKLRNNAFMNDSEE